MALIDTITLMMRDKRPQKEVALFALRIPPKTRETIGPELREYCKDYLAEPIDKSLEYFLTKPQN